MSGLHVSRKTVVSPRELSRLADVVEAKLASLPELNGYNPERSNAYHRAADAALQDLKREGAKVATAFDGARLSLGGVRSTCTAGAAGVMRNWLTAARRKLGEGS